MAQVLFSFFLMTLAGCGSPSQSRNQMLAGGFESAEFYESDESACPSDMILIPGGVYTVGASVEVMAELDPDGFSSISRIPLEELELESFCVSAWPFPGYDRPWPKDGLNMDGAGTVDELLAVYDRRLPTLGELLVATATASNDRWPSGASSWAAANCDPALYDQPAEIGAYDECVSRFGIGGLLTFSFWAVFDTATYETLAAIGRVPPSDSGVTHAVIGGLPDWREPYYGTDFYGYHAHGADDPPYSDDRGVLTVAAPYSMGDEEQAAFSGFASDFVAAGNTWTALIGE